MCFAGGGPVTWEWPRYKYGRYYPEVWSMFQGLDEQSCGKHVWMAVPLGFVRRTRVFVWLNDGWRKRPVGNLVKFLDRRCPGNRERTPCEGGNCAACAAFYPPKMCKMMAEEVMSVTWEPMCPEVFGLDEVENPGNKMEPKDEGSEELKISEGELKAIRQALKP